MSGVLYALLCFFAACWILVLGHHFGGEIFAAPVFQGSLPIAYTGAVISVGVMAVAVVAVLRR